MFKEAMEVIASQAVKAAGPQTLDPFKPYLQVKPDGSTEFIDAKTPHRKHEAKDLETLAAFADRFSAGAIWVSRGSIVFLVNDEDRRECVRVPMVLSNQIKRLADLEHSKPMMDQRAILFMLRTVFTPASLVQFPKLIDTLRQVQFTSNAAADGNIQRGKSSVGKSLSVEASFIEKVPEQITLSVPLFENAFARKTQDVQCALEIYEAEQKLQLFPLPGEVEKAFAAAEADITRTMLALLGESKVPVYYGNP